jgi:hypothetical protein
MQPVHCSAQPNCTKQAIRIHQRQLCRGWVPPLCCTVDVDVDAGACRLQIISTSPLFFFFVHNSYKRRDRQLINTSPYPQDGYHQLQSPGMQPVSEFRLVQQHLRKILLTMLRARPSATDRKDCSCKDCSLKLLHPLSSRWASTKLHLCSIPKHPE